MEQPNIAERLQKAVTDTTHSKKRSPFLYVFLLILVALVGLDVYLRYDEIPSLREETKSLKTTALKLQERMEEMIKIERDRNTQVAHLQAQLAPFEKAARQRYPDAEEAGLAKLHADLNQQEAQIIGLGDISDKQKKKIRSLHRTISDQKQEISGLKIKLAEKEEEKFFSDVATWTFDGQMKLWNGQFIDSPVAGWADTYQEESDGSTSRWKCGSAALFHYRETMEGSPRFPFPYYILARCLKEKGESSWEEYAKRGIAILEKTTKIEGHGPDHDVTLLDLQILLDTP